MKQILIIAGPNGAGKTTFAKKFLPAEAQCLRFINADLIAAGLSPFAPELMAVKAGRYAQLVDTWSLFDNDEPAPIKLASGGRKWCLLYQTIGTK